MHNSNHDQSCLLFIGLLMSVLFVSGCSSKEESPQTGNDDSKAANSAPNAEDVPLPAFPTGLCRIYGGDSASWVLVDGHPAQTSLGEYLSPPCEVKMERGSHTISLTRPGYQDVQRVVIVSESAEVKFPPLKIATANSIVTANTTLFEWPVGKPFPLSQVNSLGAELDPYLSKDGLTLWFAGDRDDGRAIYVSNRESIWHDFNPPQSLILSRSPNLPASPSVTRDGLFIYYAQPENTRIVSLNRAGPLEEFRNRKNVQFEKEAQSRWMTAQVLPDHLRMYWTAVTDKQSQGFAAVRTSPSSPFSEPIPYRLPGTIPVLSPDGLRQYQFDGTSLLRSRRLDASNEFSKPETIHKLSLPEFEQQTYRRQFFVSADEEWIVYSNGDVATADLYLVRLSKLAGWGVAPLGKPIPPKPIEVAKTPMREKMQAKDMKAQPDDSAPAVDPRSLPLPYQEYFLKWQEALAQRDLKTARQLTRDALADATFSDSRTMLQQNNAVIQNIESIWTQLEAAAQELTPDTTVPLGAARARFESFEEGVMTFRLGDKSITRPLRELLLTTIINLVQKHVDRDDGESFLSLAYFVLYDADGNEELAMNRVESYPDRQIEFIAEINRHPLHRAELELARENYPAGVVLLRMVLTNYPESAAAKTAEKLEQTLYRLTELEMVGNRQWIRDPAIGQYEAKPDRADNAYLKSKKAYRSFELQFEWKTVGRVGQGGIYFHYDDDGPVFSNAYKIHLAGDYGVSADQYCTGSLFGLEAPNKNAAKPQDEWNAARLIVRGNSIMFILNGETVLETFALSEELPEEGFVLLDGVTGGIIYRKVLLTELP